MYGIIGGYYIMVKEYKSGEVEAGSRLVCRVVLSSIMVVRSRGSQLTYGIYCTIP